MRKGRSIVESTDDSQLVVFVEIPAGSRKRYEFDPDLEAIVLDRRLFTSMSYPADYCFIEGTLGDDRDPLHALVLVGDPTPRRVRFAEASTVIRRTAYGAVFCCKMVTLRTQYLRSAVVLEAFSRATL